MTTLITREQWGAQPLKDISYFTHPQFSFVHHTTGKTLGAHLSDEWVRRIDKEHRAKGWAGIGYSFLFDAYGQIFEGRGWGVIGAHTEGWNSKGHGFAYMGDGDQPLSGEALNSLRWLISEADRKFGSLKIEGHRDTKSTHCPGDWLYSQLSTIRGGALITPITGGSTVAAPGVLVVDGGFGPRTVAKLQEALNLTGANPVLSVDTVYGPATKRALQARLNHTNGPVTIDGEIGSQTIRSLQGHIGAKVDGNWGKNTTTRLQETLNAGTF